MPKTRTDTRTARELGTCAVHWGALTVASLASAVSHDKLVSRLALDSGHNRQLTLAARFARANAGGVLGLPPPPAG